MQLGIFSRHMKVGDVVAYEINVVMNFKLGCSLDSYNSKLEMSALAKFCAVLKNSYFRHCK